MLENIEERWMVWTCRMSPKFEEHRAFCDEVTLGPGIAEGGRPWFFGPPQNVLSCAQEFRAGHVDHLPKRSIRQNNSQWHY